MVVCTMESFVIPKPPAPPPIGLIHKASIKSKKSQKSNGFRLIDSQDDTCSVYSVYKQKIDSMFESDSSTNTKNSVQARIEKMFTDVAEDSGIVLNDIGTHTFSVDYLGSVALQEKVTSLSGLQRPLKELYFAYKRTVRNQQPLTGKLEISPTGLKVQYQGEKGDLEQLNSFPTIAVWSAVKFILNEERSPSFAFLPLITDPDNINKKQLFQNLESADKKFILGEKHSPLFAVVMRKIGVNKQLECHGFVCQTSEDAIVIAATLYKSLMAHMKAKEKKPKNKNGVCGMSIASSAYNDIGNNLIPIRPPRKKRSTTSSVSSDKDFAEVSETKALLPDASKGPKKSVKNRRAPKAPEQKLDLDAIVPYEDPIQPDIEERPVEIKPKPVNETWSTYMNQTQKKIADEIKQVMTESNNMGLKRSHSVRKSVDEGTIINKVDNTGDILTKVTIPRSGSFLNAGGLTRYKSKVHRSNGQASGGSPLGFNELFNEFRLQEGLHSMDEILGVIIDSEGMSFNDLKPIYKEFLLKLSVTLTKDELYQRSKMIMRRQKKKLLRKASVKTKKSPVIICTRLKTLKQVFKKIKMANQPQKLKPSKIDNAKERKTPESSISTSSYDTRQFRPKDNAQVARKQSYRKRQNEAKVKRRERTSTSEESDFFSLRRSKSRHNSSFDTKTQNRNSSSGYVSYSECSYDSDTCTCMSADKCYCSLGQKMHTRSKCKNTSTLKSCNPEEKCYCSLGKDKGTLTWCGCDTDSCADSNKCYCQSFCKSTIFEQLKQRGIVPSSECGTPKQARKLCKKNSNTKSTRSLEYMHNPCERYYEKMQPKPSKQVKSRRKSASSENLALDYELFTTTETNGRGTKSKMIYGRSISESANYPVSLIKQKTFEKSLSGKYTQKGTTVQTTSIPTGECQEALSVKKTAEIAALFSDIKLSQTTDITHLLPKNFGNNMSTRSNYSQIIPPKVFPKLEKGSFRSEKKFSMPYNSNRMIMNSLYGAKNAKNNMYSAKNGLYTIQSQSDESRRSSVSESRRKSQEHAQDFFKFETNKNSSSQNLENALGYLP